MKRQTSLLLLLVVVALGGIALVAAAQDRPAGEQSAGEQAAGSSSKGREFVGLSRRGAFSEALDDALGKMGRAINEGGVRDGMAEWELRTISGRVGGFAGFNELSVSITAHRSPPWDGAANPQ